MVTAYAPTYESQKAEDEYDYYMRNVYAPEYISYDPDSFISELSAIKPDTKGYNAFMSEATRRGASPWANLMKASTAVDAQAQESALRNKAYGDAMNARNHMAMRGGSTGGALERLNMSANENLLGATQKAAQGYNKGVLSIGAEDEKNRLGLLSQAPGMELNRANFDVSKLAMGQDQRNKEITARNLYNSDIYKNRMSAWAADRSATAQEKAADDGK